MTRAKQKTRKRSYSSQEVGEAFRLREAGHTQREIARKMRVAQGTVSAWLRQADPRAKEPLPYTHDPTQLDDFQSSASKHTPLVQPKHPGLHDDFDAPKTWENWQRYNSQVIDRVTKQAHFEAQLGNKPVAIAFVSDQHISRGPVDLKAMREDAELIASTERLYCVLGGDGIDNHIKHRAAVLMATSVPDEQWRLFDYYLQILGDSILAVIDGNHDKWSLQYAGIDMVKWLAEQRKVCYSQDEAFIDCQVGSQTYVVAIRHQYNMNSRYNNTHAVKQWFRFGDVPFDIGVVGHHHEHATESTEIHGKRRWFARPGSYQVMTGYSRQYGYGAVTPTSPTVVLFPDRRELVGFDTVRQAKVYLEAIS